MTRRREAWRPDEGGRGRVLLTGAGGFVGRSVLAALESRADLTILCTTTQPPRPSPRGSRIEWLRHDLLTDDPEALMAQARPDMLLHLAWHTQAGSYLTGDENAAWLAASKRLLDAFLRAEGKRFVTAGSCAEYAASSAPCHETETPLLPVTAYADAKIGLFRHVEEARRSARISAAHTRLFFLYGPGEKPTRLVPDLIGKLCRGEIAETGPGDLLRDYMAVEDAGEALVALLFSDVEGPVNIAQGEAVSIAEIARRIADITGRADLLRIGSRAKRAGDAPCIVADTRRLTGELGFVPRIVLDDGLRQAVERLRTSAT